MMKLYCQLEKSKAKSSRSSGYHFVMKTRGHLQGAPFRGLIKIQCLLPLREMWFYSFCLLASMKIVDNNSLLGAKQETA